MAAAVAIGVLADGVAGGDRADNGGRGAGGGDRDALLGQLRLAAGDGGCAGGGGAEPPLSAVCAAAGAAEASTATAASPAASGNLDAMGVPDRKSPSPS